MNARGADGATEAARTERLSSRFTLVGKILFPAVFLLLFGVGTVAILVGPAEHRSSAVPLAVGLLVFLGFAARWNLPLKVVLATDRGLFVSNYRREVFVGYDQIAAVHMNRFIRSPPITVELRSACAFGRRIVFAPRFAFTWSGDHPVLALLLERARAAQTDPSRLPR